MKNWTYPRLLIAALLICAHAQGQTFFPATAPKKDITLRKNADILFSKLDTGQTKELLLFSKAKTGTEKKALTPDNDDVKNYLKKIDSLNAIFPLEFYTSLGANGTANSDRIFGTGSVGAKIRLSPYKLIGKKGWIDPHYLYLEYRTRVARSADTAVFQKTFIFPELNKSDFIIGYFWDVSKGSWKLAPHFELALNRYTDSSNKYFESQSLLAGFQVKKEIASDNWLMLDLNYNLLHVDPKFEGEFRSLIGEKNSPLAFHTISFTAAAGPPNAAMFCTMKYILNGSDRVASPNLVRLVYTIGVRAIISSNVFQIP